MPLITVPLEIGFGQSSVNVQDLENLQLHQQPLQLPLPQQSPGEGSFEFQKYNLN